MALLDEGVIIPHIQGMESIIARYQAQLKWLKKGGYIGVERVAPGKWSYSISLCFSQESQGHCGYARTKKEATRLAREILKVKTKEFRDFVKKHYPRAA